MKNFIKITFVLLFTIAAVSCKKGEVYDPYAVLDKEAPILKEYVESTEGLEGATMHESGIWYKVIQEGIQPEEDGFYNYVVNSNAQFTENPVFTVKYEGRLVPSGIEFDSSDEFKNTVFGQTIIQGWAFSFLPEKVMDSDDKVHEIGGFTEHGLQEGSIIRLVIPSPFAYGNSSSSAIPANSPLDFTIEVLSLEAQASTTSATFQLNK